MLYSQKGMATAANKQVAGQNSEQGFVYLPLIAGWLVPGAGHFLLRKWGRGALLAASVRSQQRTSKSRDRIQNKGSSIFLSSPVGSCRAPVIFCCANGVAVRCWQPPS